MLVFFKNLSLIEFWVRYSPLCCLFPVIDRSRWFQMRRTSQELVKTGVHQGSILGSILFLLYIMTFLVILSVILLSMLMILLFNLSMIRHLICGNNWNYLLNLNLMYEAQWTGARSGLLFSILEKLNWFCLTSLVTLVLLMGKWMGQFLSKNCLLRWQGCLSLLN